MTDLKQVCKIIGAYDGTNHPRNFGIGSMSIFFYVSGPHGGVSCTFSTNWYLPENQEYSWQAYSKGYPFDPLEEFMAPKGTDISVHRKYADADEVEWLCRTEECEITGGICYADGSILWAKECWQPVFLHEGSAGIFKRLEQYYNHIFHEGPEPDLTPVPRTFSEH